MGARSRGEAIIEQRLQELEPGSPRYEVLAAALQFKTSWVRLGESLAEVREAQLFREWGYDSFEVFCQEEIRITRETAAKLVRSYAYLTETRPALVEAHRSEETPPRVPDYQAVDLLAKLRENERVPESVYRDLTQATFREDLGAQELRKRVREEVPDAFARPRRAPSDPRRQLRAALSLSARLIEALNACDNIDDTILEQAEALRDMIAGRLEEL